MTSSIVPIRPARLVRRREDAQRDGEAMLEVTVSVVQPAPASAFPPTAPTGAEAHLIAQSARVRGLRGGPKVLQGARTAYLRTEWSGASDRRSGAGRTAKTEA